MGKEILGDHSLQVKLNLSVSVVSHRVVSLDVLCDGLTARASSIFEDFYSSNDHFTVLGVASWLIGPRSGILWSRYIDSQSMRVLCDQVNCQVQIMQAWVCVCVCVCVCVLIMISLD